MKVTATDLQKLTTEAGHDTPVIIKTPDGCSHEIRRVALEEVHELVPEHDEPFTGCNGSKERSEKRLVIEITHEPS